jgi:diguanylate cyclase (GGDEF)-like protein/PAS domain S-box-containing protein
MAEKTVHCLLVDDDPKEVQFFKDLLQKVDHGDCRLSHDISVSDCLDRLKKEPMDVVLLDLALPDAGGLKALEKVRGAWPQVPVIVLSGSRDEALAKESLEHGAQDFLVKGKTDPLDFVRSMTAAIEYRRLAARLEEERKRYDLVARGSRDALWDCDLVTKKIHYSERWKEMLGYGEGDAFSDSLQEWHSRIHPEDSNHVVFDLSEHFAKRTSLFSNKHRLKHKDGGYRWVLARGVAVFDASGRPARIAGSSTDLTELKQMEQKIAQHNFYDSITHLPNRAYFMENLKHLFARTLQDPDFQFAILFLDMDRIKYMNDTFGHQAGDQLLGEFTKRLMGQLRHADKASHLGGDRFTVLMGDIQDYAEAKGVADKIEAALEAPFTVPGHQGEDQEIKLDTHIGIAYSTWGYSSIQSLLQSSESAIQRSKTVGKTRFEVYEEKSEK